MMTSPSGAISLNKALEVLTNKNLNWEKREQQFGIESLETKSDGGVYTVTALRDKIIFFFYNDTNTALRHFLSSMEGADKIFRLYRTIEDKVICS